MTYDELKRGYDEMTKEMDAGVPTLDEMLNMLIKRKLVVRGIGYTGKDALFNMLSDAFVIPYFVSAPRKVCTVFRFWMEGKLYISDILRLFKRNKMTGDESRVMRLVGQTPLSTAEIIRCFERKVYDVSTPDRVIESIYPDEQSDQSRIAVEERLSTYTDAVLQAVSNLYLTRRVILEVV